MTEGEGIADWLCWGRGEDVGPESPSYPLSAGGLVSHQPGLMEVLRSSRAEDKKCEASWSVLPDPEAVMSFRCRLL